MLQLPPGDFRMGSEDFGNAKPVRIVHITRAFALSETEVTQAQYQAVMGKNPSRYKDTPDSAQHPVETVSWFDAVQYCNRLSELEGLKPCYTIQGEQVEWPDAACPGYRLPTEAEWEYAARAEQPYQYAGSEVLDRVAWHRGNADSTTHPVAQKAPNAWFLYDMSGNVWEWVWDRYSDSYLGAETQDPRGPRIGVDRVLRGGAFDRGAVFARVAFRSGFGPTYRGRYAGFRLARSYP
jgi:sulfatase modifying factor 1